MNKKLDRTTPLFASDPLPQESPSPKSESRGGTNLGLPFTEFITGHNHDRRPSSNKGIGSTGVAESALVSGIRTITRYGLRLVCEGEVHFDGAISCDRPESAARFLHQILEGIDREVFGAVYLDGRHKVIGHTIAYVGTLTHAPVEPRGVLVPALLANAMAMILFHNHPSGDPEPSTDDRQLTKRLVEAGDLVGIKVLDHIILGESPRFLSMFTRNPW